MAGLSIQYETVEDAQMRLKNTIVLYDGVPHYVDGVEHPPGGDEKEIFRVRATPLPVGPPIRKYISSRKFDLAPFPMGFLNTDNGAAFCSRAPARQQSQGLSSKNLLSEYVGECAEPNMLGGRKVRGVDFNTMMASPEFPKMVAGVYPSFVEAIAKAKQGVSCAFARELAVVPDKDLPFLTYLYYKTTKVGVVHVDSTVQLGPKRKCLKELLLEKNVQVRE